MSTKPKVVMTEFGPVTESARQQAVTNMRLDPAKRQAVLDLLIKKMGGDPETVAKSIVAIVRGYVDDDEGATSAVKTSLNSFMVSREKGLLEFQQRYPELIESENEQETT